LYSAVAHERREEICRLFSYLQFRFSVVQRTKLPQDPIPFETYLKNKRLKWLGSNYELGCYIMLWYVLAKY
jgi:hypothetical protein